MERFERVVVDERFCGPPGAGNGGYVAGVVAERAGGCSEVTLRRPTPLAAPLALRSDASGWRLETADEGVLLVEARKVAALLPAAPAVPSFAEAVRVAGPSEPHPFPHCFVCGPARGEGDGLRIFPAPLVPGRWDVVAAPWMPDASLAADGERVDARFLWSALDCPGALVAMAEQPRPMLLARMTGQLWGPVRPRERCVVVGWRIGREGRKHVCATALYGAGGRLVGTSEQLWIEPRGAAA